MSSPVPGPTPRLTEEERAHVLHLLRDSESEFLRLTSGLTAEQWTWKPAPDRWSVAQIAEHLVLGESAMVTMIKLALAAPPNPDWAAQDARKTRFIGNVLPDRSHKAAAPEPLEPHHEWTRDESMARYRSGRAGTVELVEQIDRPIKDHSARHPFPVFNDLNAYHWLLYIPLHNTRHNQQIVELLQEIVPCEP